MMTTIDIDRRSHSYTEPTQQQTLNLLLVELQSR
jgi:hypothetical protein